MFSLLVPTDFRCVHGQYVSVEHALYTVIYQMVLLASEHFRFPSYHPQNLHWFLFDVKSGQIPIKPYGNHFVTMLAELDKFGFSCYEGVKNVTFRF